MSQAKKLPARPNLDYLKKLAKERLAILRADDPSKRLADAQLAIAREYGFDSWRKLQAHVRELQANIATEVGGSALVDPAMIDQFLDTAVPRPTDVSFRDGSLKPAQAILKAHPTLAGSSLFAACALGDEKAIGRFLKDNPTLAVTAGGPRNWVPLCYLAFSRFLRDAGKKAGHFVRSAKLLLDAGADPNSWWPEPKEPTFHESVLYGAAGIANCAPLAKLLLDSGADVNDPETLYHVAEHYEHSALRVVLNAKPKLDWLSYCMCHKMDMEDPAGLKLFLEAGADRNLKFDQPKMRSLHPLHFAILRGRSVRIINMLIDAGADPMLANAQGTTPLALAVSFGRQDIVDAIRERGVSESKPTPADRVRTALASGDAAFIDRLGDRVDLTKYHGLLIDAAANGNLVGIRFMLDRGFPIDIDQSSYGRWRASALHHAAWDGHAEAVKLLLERGADPMLKNPFGGTALGSALHAVITKNHDRGWKSVQLIAESIELKTLKSSIEHNEEAGNAEAAAVLRAVLQKRESAGNT